MIVEQIYLENKTTRKAFYHVKIIKNDITASGKLYRVEIQWGRLGTEGRTTIKKHHTFIESARTEMHKLAEAKKMKNYHEAKKSENSASSKVLLTNLVKPNISPDVQRFLTLELDE